jgi:hypothetical protein
LPERFECGAAFSRVVGGRGWALGRSLVRRLAHPTPAGRRGLGRGWDGSQASRICLCARETWASGRDLAVKRVRGQTRGNPSGSNCCFCATGGGLDREESLVVRDFYLEGERWGESPLSFLVRMWQRPVALCGCHSTHF